MPDLSTSSDYLVLFLEDNTCHKTLVIYDSALGISSIIKSVF